LLWYVSGGDLGGSKLKATFKSFRARAISVLELNGQSQILACTEYYDRSTMPIGDETPFDQLPWPHKDLAEAALSTRMGNSGPARIVKLLSSKIYWCASLAPAQGGSDVSQNRFDHMRDPLLMPSCRRRPAMKIGGTASSAM